MIQFTRCTPSHLGRWWGSVFCWLHRCFSHWSSHDSTLCHKEHAFINITERDVWMVHSFLGKPISELRGITCHMGTHNVTCYHGRGWTSAPLIPAKQVGTRFAYRGEIKGWKTELILVVSYLQRRFTCSQRVSRNSSSHFTVTWWESKPWLLNRKSKVLTITLLSHLDSSSSCSERSPRLGMKKETEQCSAAAAL